MTITATTNRIQYTGDGSSTGFAFPFRIFAATDLEVFLAGVLQTTGYSVTGGDPSGTVNFAAAPGSGVAVLIRRAVPATQPLDYVENDPFPAETHEAGLDRATILAIQLAELLQTCLRLPRSEALIGELAGAALRANKYLGFDNTGAATLVTGQPAGPGLTEAYWWGGSAGGTASAHVVTVSSPPSAYADGQRFYYRAPAASTGATTTTISGIGDIPIRKGGGATELSAGDIPAANALVGIIIAGGGTIGLLSNVIPSVDLSAYAALAAANSFSEPQAIAKALAGTLLTLRSTDAGALAANMWLQRQSASPAANDALFDLSFVGRDDAPADRTYGRLSALLRDPVAATAEGELQALVLLAGSLTAALSIRNGLLVGAASGGFQGTGTVNAGAFYRNGQAIGGSLHHAATLSSAAAAIVAPVPAGRFKVFIRAIFASGPADFGFDVSFDGGSTWVTAGMAGTNTGNDQVSAVARAITAGATFMPFTNTSRLGGAGEIWANLDISNVAGQAKPINGLIGYQSAAVVLGSLQMAARHTATAAITHIRFRESAAVNLETGSVVQVHKVEV